MPSLDEVSLLLVWTAIAIYALGIGTWWSGKRWCLRRVTKGGLHASA